MRLAARYAPQFSHRVVDAVADVEEKKTTNLVAVLEATKLAVRDAETKIDLTLLFSDLICALNGTDYLPFVAGVAASEVIPFRSPLRAE